MDPSKFKFAPITIYSHNIVTLLQSAPKVTTFPEIAPKRTREVFEQSTVVLSKFYNITGHNPHDPAPEFTDILTDLYRPVLSIIAYNPSVAPSMDLFKSAQIHRTFDNRMRLATLLKYAVSFDEHYPYTSTRRQFATYLHMEVAYLFEAMQSISNTITSSLSEDQIQKEILNYDALLERFNPTTLFI